MNDPQDRKLVEATVNKAIAKKQDKYLFEQRGAISVKGKGEMTTYWLLERKSEEVALKPSFQ